jgi:hypothetical protein
MKLKFLLLILIPTLSLADTHKEYMDTYLPQVISHLEQDFPGPLARDLGSVALARQILEDGLHKGSRYSVAGIGTGNRDIVEPTVFRWLTIGRASDSEGTFYSFKGPQAGVCSAVIIAKLFDSYVYKFLPKNEVQWELIKDVSAHVNDTSCTALEATYEALEPEKMILKVNRMFGPNAAGVERIAR